jgi:hypothetical protein
MKNFNDIKDFLDANPSNKEISQISNPLIKALILAVKENETFELQALALEDMNKYLNFIENFTHLESNKFLFFSNFHLLTHLITAHNHELVKTYLNYNPSSKLQIYQILESLNFDFSINYLVKENQLVLNNQLNKFKYLLDPIEIAQSDELSLLKDVYDLIPLELSLQSDRFIVDLKKGVSLLPPKDSIMTKFNLAVSRFAQSDATKYVGVALALGLAFIGEASAGVNEASDYINAVNNSLNQMQGDLPAGCEFGAKVISKNGLGMTYEVQLGDYVVNTKFTKLGNISETLDQTIYKLKEAKGCGLDKSDVSEMSKKITQMVSKLWSAK